MKVSIFINLLIGRNIPERGKNPQYAIAGARLALMDAGLTLERDEEVKAGTVHREGQYRVKGLDPFRIGVILGVGVEAMELMEHYHERFMSRGSKGLSPFGLPNIYLSSITSHVAQNLRSEVPLTPFQRLALQPPMP